MKFTNYEIYAYSQGLNQVFTKRDQRLPAKLSFCVLKNTQTLNNLVQEIEESRIEIIKQYGETQEDGNIRVAEDKIEQANKEINDLFEVKQEVNILKVDINSFGDLDLTFEQMDAIMFMVEGE